MYKLLFPKWCPKCFHNKLGKCDFEDIHKTNFCGSDFKTVCRFYDPKIYKDVQLDLFQEIQEV